MPNVSQAGSGALGGAGTGALVGSAIAPGIGTAIGAGIGAIGGALPGLFSSGPPPINTAYNYNPDGTISSYGIGYDNFQSPAMINPMDVNPYTSNPYAGQQLADLGGLRSVYGNMLNESMDPSYYNSLKANAIMGQTTGIDNSYAKMGLAGSSANLGADQSAINQTNMQFFNRQQGDQYRAAGALAGLDNNMYNDIMGVQGQYGGYQSSIMDTLTSLHNGQQQQQAANNQMWGNLMGSGLQAGATYAGMQSKYNW